MRFIDVLADDMDLIESFGCQPHVLQRFKFPSAYIPQDSTVYSKQLFCVPEEVEICDRQVEPEEMAQYCSSDC